MDEFVLLIWSTDKTGSVSTYAVKGATWKKFIANLFIRLTTVRFLCKLRKEKIDLHFSKPGVKPAEEPPGANSQQFMKCCTHYGLSDRQIDVAALLAKAYSEKEICGALHISYHAMNSHTKEIFKKLKVTTRSEAALKLNADPSSPEA